MINNARVKRILKHGYFLVQRLRTGIFPRPYPVNDGNKVYIHLGCGDINGAGYINVDGRYFPHIHRIGRVEHLPFFKNDFADLIYTSHTLEHIRMNELKEVLSEWKRILKPGGILRISVPDFDCITEIYKENDRDIKFIWYFLLGNQDYNENFHYSVFNRKFLKELLLETGFTEVREWYPSETANYTFNDWASRKVEYGGKEYQISLNIEAVK